MTEKINYMFRANTALKLKIDEARLKLAKKGKKISQEEFIEKAVEEKCENLH